jgi:hypothetical protein
MGIRVLASINIPSISKIPIGTRTVCTYFFFIRDSISDNHNRFATRDYIPNKTKQKLFDPSNNFFEHLTACLATFFGIYPMNTPGTHALQDDQPSLL